MPRAADTDENRAAAREWLLGGGKMEHRFEEFGQLAGLGSDELRGLLDAGDGRERVWAAWALGLRAAADAVPDLSSALRAEPSPGVRRHIVVTLAGLGELLLLQVIATADPDPYVRATAYQHLAMQAAPDNPAAFDILLHAVRDGSPLVRRAVAEWLSDDAPESVAGAVAGLAGEVDGEARDAVARYLVRGRNVPDDALHVAWTVLHGRCDQTVEAAIMVRLFERVGGKAIFESAVRLDSDAVAAAADILIRHVVAVDWSWLGAGTKYREPRISRRLEFLCPAEFQRHAAWPTPNDDVFPMTDEAGRRRAESEMADWLVGGWVVSAGLLEGSPFVGVWSRRGGFLLRYSRGWVDDPKRENDAAQVVALHEACVAGLSFQEDGSVQVRFDDGRVLRVLAKLAARDEDEWDEPHERFWDLREEPRRVADGGGRITVWQSGTVSIWRQVGAPRSSS